MLFYKKAQEQIKREGRRERDRFYFFSPRLIIVCNKRCSLSLYTTFYFSQSKINLLFLLSFDIENILKSYPRVFFVFTYTNYSKKGLRGRIMRWCYHYYPFFFVPKIRFLYVHTHKSLEYTFFLFSAHD